jgi:hypothetical protein
VAALDAAAAFLAASYVDCETPVGRLDLRDLGLVLEGDPLFLDRSVAVRTPARKGSVVLFIDSGRDGAECGGAVSVARLPSGTLRVLLGLPLGEGSCLSLAGTTGFLEEIAEYPILLFTTASKVGWTA